MSRSKFAEAGYGCGAVNFQATVLKVLVSYPDGFAAMADLKRDMAFWRAADGTGLNARSDWQPGCPTWISSPKISSSG
jgi:hypothetical protein